MPNSEKDGSKKKDIKKSKSIETKKTSANGKKAKKKES